MHCCLLCSKSTALHSCVESPVHISALQLHITQVSCMFLGNACHLLQLLAETSSYKAGCFDLLWLDS
jgi:hypothetical protein